MTLTPAFFKTQPLIGGMKNWMHIITAALCLLAVASTASAHTYEQFDTAEIFALKEQLNAEMCHALFLALPLGFSLIAAIWLVQSLESRGIVRVPRCLQTRYERRAEERRAEERREEAADQ